MKQIYYNALQLIEKRIQQCGRAIQCETDGVSVAYWHKELALAHYKKQKVFKRLKPNHNVIRVDFLNKRRAA